MLAGWRLATSGHLNRVNEKTVGLRQDCRCRLLARDQRAQSCLALLSPSPSFATMHQQCIKGSRPCSSGEGVLIYWEKYQHGQRAIVIEFRSPGGSERCKWRLRWRSGLSGREQRRKAHRRIIVRFSSFNPSYLVRLLVFLHDCVTAGSAQWLLFGRHGPGFSSSRQADPHSSKRPTGCAAPLPARVFAFLVFLKPRAIVLGARFR